VVGQRFRRSSAACRSDIACSRQPDRPLPKSLRLPEKLLAQFSTGSSQANIEDVQLQITDGRMHELCR